MKNKLITFLSLAILLSSCVQSEDPNKNTSSSDISSSEIITTTSTSSSYDTTYGYLHVTPSYSGTYYSTVSESLRSKDLILALDKILDAARANVTFTYTGMKDIFPYTDADPNNLQSGKILSFYSGTPSSWSAMNREHTWPDSRGGGSIEKDPHMVRPTLTKENSDRGNSFFNEGASWDPASFKNEKYRGIAARIIFYCAVKAQESGLNLVDLNTQATSAKSMGKLSTLLKWNLQYDIDATELLRNNVLFDKYSHCRNPFIDDRNYACKIWGNTNDTTKQICQMN